MPETECLVSLPQKNPLHLQTSSFSGGNSIMPVTESKIFGITSDPSLSYLITNPSAILSGQLSVGIQNLTTSLHLCQCHGLSFHHVTWVISMHFLIPPEPPAVYSQHCSQTGTCKVSDSITPLFNALQQHSISIF